MLVDIDEYTRLQDDGCPNCDGHLGSAWENHAFELISRTMTARMEYSGKLGWNTSNAPAIRKPKNFEHRGEKSSKWRKS